MRAAQVKAFGGPEVLATVELPDPVPGPGEVLIEVAHADTIFVETQVRTGLFRAHFPVEPPYVPGGGVAGTVTAVGAGVDAGWVGRRVTSFVAGSYAERVTAPVTAPTPVPDGLDLRTAAALVHDGVTAAGLLEHTAVGAGDRVLILGASGGMGTLLIQLARARGARVVAAARGARKSALVRELGADAVVDVSAPDWVERARQALGRPEPTRAAEAGAEATTGTTPEAVADTEPVAEAAADVVLDGVGGELGLSAFPLTADGGRFSAHGAPSGGFAAVSAAEAERRGVTLFGIGDVQFGEAEARRLTAHVLAEATAGRLRPVIGARFPLTEAAAAHAAIEGRDLIGKVVLDV
ncbi:zinc-binding dehydrogenase [Streptomyces sp. SLBN-115]|uniref:zinc-binding dehydrogenase n=1 Tax=Streptomyces sp. SLBN-115 TaxID=2768453 RepID=UPI00116E3F42|nr:zinc-binding dehydrogenase [Streptomyces sp. SLBN-115]TQJ53965.1 NADPH2:quinone reductase [Streptomyces sp. SLBN-115]